MNFRSIILAIITISVTASGCAFVSLKNWFEQKGTVYDGNNKLPISNAIVAAVWRGKDKNYKDGKLVCYHVETTKTNKIGEFQIPGWREYFEFSHMQDKEVVIVVFKTRYWSQQTLMKAPTEKANTYNIHRVSRKNKQVISKYRLRYLQKLVGVTGCDLAKDNRHKLQPMYSKILKEAEKTAKTRGEMNVVKSLRNWTTFVASNQTLQKTKKN